MNRIILICLLVAMIGGCASKGTKVSTDQFVTTKDPIWQKHYQQISKISSWEAKGKIAASHQGEGGSASFVWENLGNVYKIRLFGPFGAGSAELTSSQNQVILEQADGNRFVASTPEKLLYQQTGLNIPVRGLMSWIKGLPSSHEPVRDIQINSEGQLVYLNQGSWQIIYERYIDLNGRQMPSKLSLSRDGMKVKIIIKSWEI